MPSSVYICNIFLMSYAGDEVSSTTSVYLRLIYRYICVRPRWKVERMPPIHISEQINIGYVDIDIYIYVYMGM